MSSQRYTPEFKDEAVRQILSNTYLLQTRANSGFTLTNRCSSALQS